MDRGMGLHGKDLHFIKQANQSIYSPGNACMMFVLLYITPKDGLTVKLSMNGLTVKLSMNGLVLSGGATRTELDRSAGGRSASPFMECSSNGNMDSPGSGLMDILFICGGVEIGIGFIFWNSSNVGIAVVPLSASCNGETYEM